jgi:DNA polymerase-3 subunit beta
MKFSIQRTPLLEALQKTQSVVEKKNTVPILSNILCQAKGNEISLSATDLEVGIKVNVPAEVRQEGKLTLSAKQFLDIVKELPEQRLDISKKDNSWVEIICGKSKFNIVSLSADEYPPLPNFEEKNYLDASVDSLASMIDRTAFAISTDATRYHLNGVYFEHLENNVMRMTATDGHRLSFVDSEVFLKMPELKRGITIPKKGLSELRKVLGFNAESSSGTIGLSFERGYLFVHVNETYLFIRLIEGEYPDVRGVIPKSADKKAIINKEIFHSALKRVSLLAHEKSKGIKFNLEQGLLVISSSNPDMGDAREEIDIMYNSDPVEIGFNARYLLDCLPVMNSENLELSFKDRLSPGILKGAEQPNHTYVIMPMRI